MQLKLFKLVSVWYYFKDEEPVLSALLLVIVHVKGKHNGVYYAKRISMGSIQLQGNHITKLK